MKATSLFGGVQVVNILIGIVRSKFIAVLLGPEGMGIAGLLNTTTAFISGLTNFGLGTSAVKNVSAANGTGDKQRIGEVVAVLRRLVWFTGILGMVLTIVLSPWLSELTFGNRDYTLAFVWISITLLLNQISSGQSVVLQGMRQLKYLAQSSVSGAFIGLFISVPIYYVWGIDGIVPAIIISSVAALLRTWYFARKVPIEKLKPSALQTKTVGKEMLTMGFMLSVSGLYVLAKNYGLKIYISNIGSIGEVGLFTAGFAIVNTYVGLVFKAMSTDYFPRLASVAHNNNDAGKLINQQAEIAILILAPILSVFIVFNSWIIMLLYTNKFLSINLMVQWMALGVLFKAVSWSVAYIILAKAKSGMFLANELIGGTVTLICNLLGYYFGGLTGMGIGFMVGYFYYMLQVFFVAQKYFEFKFEKKFLKLFLFQFLLALACFIVALIFSKRNSYIISVPLISISVMYSYRELDKRIDIKKIFKRILNKK